MIQTTGTMVVQSSALCECVCVVLLLLYGFITVTMATAKCVSS